MTAPIRLFAALPCAMALAGCVAALPPAPGPSPSGVPPTMPSSPASATPPASPAPSSTPALWLEATFEDPTGLNPGADVAAFDTRKPREEGQLAGGTFSAWRETTNYGTPHSRAFVVEGSWSYGMTPWNGRRALQLWFLAEPTAGQRFTLAAGAPSTKTARLTYHQESRFRQDVWAATAGTLTVEAGEGGAVRVVATEATMAPDPQGAGFGSQATGTFRLAAEGLAWPRDQREGATPVPTAVPDGLDLNGIWTFALPGASPTPIPACGTAAYRRYKIADPERDGRDMTVTVDTLQPPMGDAGATRVEGTMAGRLVGDRYDFEGTLTYTSPAGAKTTGREALHLRYDAAAGELVGEREVGASVEQGGRGGLPVTLRRPLLAPQPEGGCQ